MFTSGFAHVESESQSTRQVSVADLQGVWGVRWQDAGRFFLFMFVIFQNSNEATFLKSEKKTDDGHLKQMREA